ncbi:hypothetical protein [Fluviispira sanaruensis]|uniref:Uncharacterized protein n=1 Tax=Fluviispira sanaruensis TaxID=2493639 RepID=A0A4P2VP79_FLUSA|nr:hypothetical protein [Fluviispira sanaruensis]BBH54024.1 hypothetical protein JCM31447_24810 [Fluviispira sanaruensis]
MKNLSVLSVVGLMIPCLSYAGMPKLQSTTLPLPVDKTMEQIDKQAIDYVVGIPVYQDQVDIHQYYYVPKLKASTNADGVSATFLKNDVAVSSSSVIADLSVKVSSLTTEEYFNARKTVIDLENIINETIKRNPADPNIQVYQTYLNKAIEKKTEIEKKASGFEQTLPQGILTSIYNNIATIFGAAGIHFPIHENENVTARHNRLNQKLVDLNSSNGGLITGNIYGGFSDSELLKIKTYKSKYAQNIKVSVIPLASLSFESLTELQYDANGVKSQRAGIPIFSSLKGGGTLTGATFNFDLTTNGAVSFARNLSPFIPPISVKGVLQQNINPYNATLDCDFGPGLIIKDRSIINKQVAVFNDNTVSNMIMNGPQSQSHCRITVHSGDSQAALIAATQALESEIVKLKVQKSNLSAQDRSQYWQQMQQQQGQIHDRTAQNNGHQNVFQAYQQSGWAQSAVSAIAQRPNYYWQTNAQEMASLSGLKIHREIVSNNARSVNISIPTNICFVWNVHVKAYRACNEGEQATALPLTDATQAARQSQSCANVQDANSCGENRNTNAPTSPEGNILPDNL